MNSIQKYASLVKFSHTIFAMPFAIIAYVYAITENNIEFNPLLLLQILLCMVTARNCAMGFNRWADRKIDAKNPRTVNREIPASIISAKSAIIFIVINALIFTAVAASINMLTFALSPIALIVICGYSYTKRFTSFAHIVLGLALAIAPAGAYIAVTGQLSIVPMILSLLVITWVAGFDILYSLQDIAFDRDNNLHSIPARLGEKGALIVSALLHIVSIALVWLLNDYLGNSMIYTIGAIIFTLMLIFQHAYFTPSRLQKVGATFGLMNGIISIVFSIFVIIDMLCR